MEWDGISRLYRNGMERKERKEIYNLGKKSIILVVCLSPFICLLLLFFFFFFFFKIGKKIILRSFHYRKE